MRSGESKTQLLYNKTFKNCNKIHFGSGHTWANCASHPWCMTSLVSSSYWKYVKKTIKCVLHTTLALCTIISLETITTCEWHTLSKSLQTMNKYNANKVTIYKFTRGCLEQSTKHKKQIIIPNIILQVAPGFKYPSLSPTMIKIWSALFVNSLSTDWAVFVDRLPAFRPAEVARHMYWDTKVKKWTTSSLRSVQCQH